MAVTSRVIEGGVTSITQPYHINGAKGYDYDHWGIDLTGFNGKYNVLAWITAHSDGVVAALRNDCTGFEYNSYGNYVLLEHADGSRTMYAHLSYNTVQVYVGQKVVKGQRLGYMGNTGTSYGGHLHFEIRRADGYQIDPEPFLNTALPSTYKWIRQVNGVWYYFVGANIDYSYNGVAQNEYGWWKCKNGQVDFSFTGLAQNQNGWWYCKNGKVDFSYNGIVQNANGWWKVTNGKVDFSYNGLAQNENGWFMIQSGKVDFNYNGLAINEYGTWYLEKGKINFNFNGYVHFSGKEYMVGKGKVVGQQ